MRILLGVTGGVSAYKAVEFTRLAIKAGHRVRVVQTPNSSRFIGEETFSAVTGAPVLNSQFQVDPLRGAYPGDQLPEHVPISHLALVENADLFLIAPATANAVASLATGRAENLVTAAALAATCPVIVAPAMNNAMYENSAVQANLQTLRSRGIQVIEPDTGQLASKGEFGKGRLPEPAKLLHICEESFTDGVNAKSIGQSLAGKRVLITAGGTREPIDSVRFIGNRSSGRMGFALAEAAAKHGAEVTVIAANVALPRSPVVSYLDVSTAAELKELAEREFSNCDVLLMAAAVADFKPSVAVDSKIKKESKQSLELELVATDDILSALSQQRKTGQILVGFAAEHGEVAIENGRKKLDSKQLDLVVVNDISRSDIGFESTENEVHLVDQNSTETVAKTGKDSVAESIILRVVKFLAEAKQA